MAPSSCSSGFRALVVSLLLSAVLAAFTTSPTHRLSHLGKVPLKYPRFEVSPSALPSRTVETPGDAGLLGEREERKSLRQLLRKFIQFTTRNKRKKLASLLFALSVWLRGGLLPYLEVPVAHAGLVVEHVHPNNLLFVGGSSNAESSTVDVSETSLTVATSNQKGGTNAKVATALASAAVVLPSAGLVVARGKKKEGEEAGKDTVETSKKGAEDTLHSDNQKKDFVHKVLDKAKKSRLKMDSDAYLKSLTKEKSIITNAKLTQQLESGPFDEDEPDEVPTTDSEDVAVVLGAAASTEVSARDDALPTNTDLPLMTPQFVQARQQPKDASEERLLQQKYQAIADVGQRAFNILVDLGMLETDDESIVIGLPAAEDEEPFQ